MGVAVCSSQARNPVPAAKATAKSARMVSDSQPWRWPLDRPLSRLTRKTDIKAKPIQSKRRGGPDAARPGRNSAAANRPRTQNGTAMKKT